MALFKKKPTYFYALLRNINAKSHNKEERTVILQSQAPWLTQ